MSNVIPGTDLVASEGVKSSFAEYFDNREAQEVLRKAQETARENAETKTKGPRVNDKKAAAQKIFDELKFSDGTECMLESINLGDAEKEAQKLVDSMIARMDNEHNE